MMDNEYRTPEQQRGEIHNAVLAHEAALDQAWAALTDLLANDAVYAGSLALTKALTAAKTATACRVILACLPDAELRFVCMAGAIGLSETVNRSMVRRCDRLREESTIGR